MKRVKLIAEEPQLTADTSEGVKKLVRLEESAVNSPAREGGVSMLYKEGGPKDRHNSECRSFGDPNQILNWSFVLMFLWLAIVAFGEEIDRLLVAVNGRVVTEGDLRLARNLNALLAPGGNGAERSREEEINRLVDLELMRQELTNFAAIKGDESEIESRMQDLRNKYAEIGGLPALLRDLGLQESELRSYIGLQISIEKFIQFRFRPFVTVSPEEILAYYRQKLVPRLEKSPGARIPDLEEVTAQIEEILAQEKVNTSVDNWLKDIRRHSRIESFTRPTE